MKSQFDFNALRNGIVWNKSSSLCLTCLGFETIQDPEDNSENWDCGVIQCPDCHGEGVIYHDGFDERSTLSRELWASVWKAALLHLSGDLLVWEAFNLMTDSMLFAHMLDMTPLQLFDLIKASRKLLSDRDAAPQQTMLQYKLALRNGEVGFDEDLPF